MIAREKGHEKKGTNEQIKYLKTNKVLLTTLFWEKKTGAQGKKYGVAKTKKNWTSIGQ